MQAVEVRLGVVWIRKRTELGERGQQSIHSIGIAHIQDVQDYNWLSYAPLNTVSTSLCKSRNVRCPSGVERRDEELLAIGLDAVMTCEQAIVRTCWRVDTTLMSIGFSTSMPRRSIYADLKPITSSSELVEAGSVVLSERSIRDPLR